MNEDFGPRLPKDTTMETIAIPVTPLRELFRKLGQQFEVPVQREMDSYHLKIENDHGNGSISGGSLKGDISYLAFDITFAKETCIGLMSPEIPSASFAYCSQGPIFHGLGEAVQKVQIESYQTTIFIGIPGKKNRLGFARGQQTQIFLINVALNAALNKENSWLEQGLNDIFIADRFSWKSRYVGSFNLKIAQKIRQLNTITQKGLVKSLLTEALVLTILGLEIQQYVDDRNQENTTTDCLNIQEMAKVRELSSYIQDTIDSRWTVDQLCQRSGLSPAKLQQGFKMMHGSTVNDYIQGIRITKAEQLLKKTDLNISEVVYGIGFTSRSCFLRLFMKKFKCLPNEYKLKHNISNP